jgi:hypothetical protein
MDIDKDETVWFNRWSYRGESQIDCEYLYQSLEANHPGLASHREALSSMVKYALNQAGLGEISGDATYRVSELVLRYFVQDILQGGSGLLGPTEAAELLGVTPQRMSQIARENVPPRPIARLGGERPVWLRDDVEDARESR